MGRWTDAYITQPPVKDMKVEVKDKGVRFTWERTLREDQGLKLRHLRDALMEALTAKLELRDRQRARMVSRGYSVLRLQDSAETSLKKWGEGEEAAPGEVCCTVQGSIADTSDWVTEAINWYRRMV